MRITIWALLFLMAAGAIGSLVLLGCTDTQRASLSAFGTPGHITCYSGPKVIYEGDSTGRISTVDHSDGWEFQEKGTHNFIRVSGACVIKN